MENDTYKTPTFKQGRENRAFANISDLRVCLGWPFRVEHKNWETRISWLIKIYKYQI